MSAMQFKCESCGASLSPSHRFSKLVSCQYCGSTSIISYSGSDPTGQSAALVELPSILQVGTDVKIQNTLYRVLGQVRFKYEDGHWDEWLLTNESTKVWLQEDDGLFTLFKKEAIRSALPSFEEVKVGSIITLNERQVFITEKERAVVAGASGQLLEALSPGERCDFFDGNWDGRTVSIERWRDELYLSVGSEVNRKEVITRL